MLFMGIDQSFTKTGIVITDQDNNVVGTKLVFSDKTDDVFMRAWKISEGISEVIKQHNPDMIGIEGLAYSMKGNATRDLAGLQFTIVNRIRFIHGLDVAIVSPLMIKKVATGKGHAKKDEMINALPDIVLQFFLAEGVKKSKGLTDLADAYWICRCINKKYLSAENII